MGFEQIEVKLLDWFPKQNGDKQIAHAAWASSFDLEKLESKSFEDISRVVNQIVDNQHDTPKETVWMNFFLRTPIFVERQLDKYRLTIQQQNFTIEYDEGAFGRHGVTQNELSGRYRTLPDRFYELPDDVYKIMRQTDEDYNYMEVDVLLEEQYFKYKEFLDRFPEDWKKRGNPNNHKYKRVREVLRGLLGTSYLTDYRIMLNLNAFEHIMNQRLDPGTQLETRVTAYKMLREAQSKEVASVAIERMVSSNGWQDWLDDLQVAIG